VATEKLKFKIELYATMWNSPPHAEIMIDDKSHFNGNITTSESDPTSIEFTHEFNEGSSYDLIIKRSNKGKNQTIVNEKGDILKDQILHIKNIEIDEIDIGALVYEGLYTPEYPEPWATQQNEAGNTLEKSFKSVTKMGHNGEWRLGFASPFYMWLLENLY
jgi:hypothetical protein